MAHLDLDTDTLADAASRLRAAADAVTVARAGGGGPVASGDPALDAAAEDFWAAWGAAHHALLAEVDALAGALAQAAATFEGAERVTAAGLAHLLSDAT